jgi:hypothetical protein
MICLFAGTVCIISTHKKLFAGIIIVIIIYYYYYYYYYHFFFFRRLRSHHTSRNKVKVLTYDSCVFVILRNNENLEVLSPSFTKNDEADDVW